MIVQFLILFLFIQIFDKTLGKVDDVTYCYVGDDSDITKKCSSNWCYTLRSSTNMKVILDKGCDNANVFCKYIGNTRCSNLKTFFNYSTSFYIIDEKEICCCNWTLCNSTSTQSYIKHSFIKVLAFLILLIFLLTNIIL
uniref:Activin_recp domain-containing protein n=1 Tax=Strongyloides stercoralis TaxID=6248 RepID=A0A0K0DYG8_STRER